MSWNLFVDLVVAVLLAVTIVYAVSLNRKMGTLRRDRAELGKIAADFEASIRRAEDGIGRLKVSAEALQTRVDAAKRVHDDLAFLIERGERLADGLETRMRDVRGQNEGGNVRPLAAPGPAKPAKPAKRETAVPPRSEAERELLKALAAQR